MMTGALRMMQPQPWHRAVASAAIATSLVTIVGCRYPNCDHIVDDRCVDDTGNDAATCASSASCALPAGVCDLAGTRRCVQCTQNQAGACTGMTPACGAERVCRACQAHAECPLSAACLPDGSCAAEADVAYVDPQSTDNASCSLRAPCFRVATALATGRRYVKLRGTIDEAVTLGGGRVVSLLADPGATLTRRSTDSQPVLTVQGDGTSVEVHDLAIADALDTATIGVVIPPASGSPVLALTRVTIASNPGGGISISGGLLTIAQSVVSDNLGGGITVNTPAKFQIVGNVFIDNGSGITPFGAIAIATIASPDDQLELNSFYRNASQDGVGAAIRCDATAFVARNNLMYANGTATNHAQVSGTCAHHYSLTQLGSAPAGIGNLAADPLFKDAAGGDLHVLPGSPALRAGDPASDLAGPAAVDRDGAPRISPPTIGAYQSPSP